jgi:hypothetical protein
VKAGWLNVTLRNDRNTNARSRFSRSSKKHFIVSPMCPRSFNDSELPCSVFELFEVTLEAGLFRAERKRIYSDLEHTDDAVGR